MGIRNGLTGQHKILGHRHSDHGMVTRFAVDPGARSQIRSSTGLRQPTSKRTLARPPRRPFHRRDLCLCQGHGSVALGQGEEDLCTLPPRLSIVSTSGVKAPVINSNLNAACPYRTRRIGGWLADQRNLHRPNWRPPLPLEGATPSKAGCEAMRCSVSGTAASSPSGDHVRWGRIAPRVGRYVSRYVGEECYLNGNGGGKAAITRQVPRRSVGISSLGPAGGSWTAEASGRRPPKPHPRFDTLSATVPVETLRVLLPGVGCHDVTRAVQSPRYPGTTAHRHVRPALPMLVAHHEPRTLPRVHSRSRSAIRRLNLSGPACWYVSAPRWVQ